MTNAAKLAWAADAGVTPPEYVVVAAAQEADANEGDHDHDDHDLPQLAAGGCCSSKAKSCCSATKSCCSTRDQRVAAAPTGASERSVTVVHLISAMKCRGLTASVGLLPPSLPVLSAELFPHAPERFQSALGESLLYDEPYLAVASPPPDGGAC